MENTSANSQISQPLQTPPQPIPQPVLSQTQKTPSPIVMIVIGVIALVLVGVGGYILGTHQVNSPKMSDTNPAISASPTSMPTESPSTPAGDNGVACTMEAKLCPDGSYVSRSGPKCEFAACPSTSTKLPDGYIRRNYNPTDKLIDDKSYPTELTSVKDAGLLGMKCSEAYTIDATASLYYSYTQNATKARELDDAEILKNVAIVKKSTSKNVDTFVSCKTTNNQTFFEFDTQAGGGGAGNTATFGLVKDNQFEEVASIKNPGAPYFSCAVPLQITTSNQFFFKCGGGDGGSGAGGVYKVDITNKKATQVVFYETHADTP
jgi:hypothetical protein